MGKENNNITPSKFDRKDRKYWKLGFLYYNPEDTNFIVDKRTGIGFTINFATICGKIFAAFLILIITFVIIMTIFFS